MKVKMSMSVCKVTALKSKKSLIKVEKNTKELLF